MLVARAAEARDVLPDALRERGAEVDVVALYETVPRGARAPRPSRPRQSADYVTFTSSSTVRNLIEALGRPVPQRRPGRLDRPGDQRGRPRAGLEVHVEAERHDVDGLSRRCCGRGERGPYASPMDAAVASAIPAAAISSQAAAMRCVSR